MASAYLSSACVQACVAQLWRHNVDLEATLLKPMMIMPGADASSKASPKEVSHATLDALKRCSVHVLILNAALYSFSLPHAGTSSSHLQLIHVMS